jgi:XRE family transcriptional regulator, regulator of sulfur utilization
MTLVRNFGAAVRHLRELQGWSQEQLAEHAGLNRSYVGEIERGSAIASIVTVDKLARALGVSIERLLRPAADKANVAATDSSAAFDPASLR